MCKRDTPCRILMLFCTLQRIQKHLFLLFVFSGVACERIRNPEDPSMLAWSGNKFIDLHAGVLILTNHDQCFAIFMINAVPRVLKNLTPPSLLPPPAAFLSCCVSCQTWSHLNYASGANWVFNYSAVFHFTLAPPWNKFTVVFTFSI